MPEDSNQSSQQQQKQQIQIQIPEALQGGVYSNAISVNVNANEVVVDMGYLVPNSNPRMIKVVSRVNMNHRTAESFMRILQDAMLDFRNRQKEAREKEEKK